MWERPGTARLQAHFTDYTDSDVTTSEGMTTVLSAEEIQSSMRMMTLLEGSRNQNQSSLASVPFGIASNASGISYS